jgi:hypothetical protein
MNTKNSLRLVRLRPTPARQGVPRGEATRGATNFVSKFILGDGGKSRLREEVMVNQRRKVPVKFLNAQIPERLRFKL